MEHFRDRLPIYYPGDVTDTGGNPIQRSKLAKRLLNHLALSNSPQSIDDCFNALKVREQIHQRDIVTSLLELLAKDHYLDRDSNWKYVFRFPLVKRWWIGAEGLHDEK